MNPDLTPFQRGGDAVPVKFVAPVPPLPGETLDLDQSSSPSGRRRGIIAALVVLVTVVFAGQLMLRPPDDSWLSPQLVASLDVPPPAIASAHAFLQIGAVDLTARVSLGGRTVQVRSVSNNGRTALWEREVATGQPVGAVQLVNNSADRRILLSLAAPRTLDATGSDDAGVVISLSLDDGRELSRRGWDSRHTFIPAADGRLYRLDTDTSEIQAMQDINAVRWRTAIDPYMWLGHPVELRPHGRWLLLGPDSAGRRATMRGSDVFLTAFDPDTGLEPDWLVGGVPGQRFQRLALKDLFVEHSVGAGERVVRARAWDDGQVHWQRFDEGVIPLAVDDELYLTSATVDGTRLMKVDPINGRTRWEAELEGTMTLLLAGVDAVVAAVPDENLTFFDGDSGEVLGRLPYEGAPFLGSGTYFTGSLDPAGHLVVTNRSSVDGSTIWTETYQGFRTLAQVRQRLLLLDPDGSRVAPLYPP